jgi:hypothetical protein
MFVKCFFSSVRFRQAILHDNMVYLLVLKVFISLDLHLYTYQLDTYFLVGYN